MYLKQAFEYAKINMVNTVDIGSAEYWQSRHIRDLIAESAFKGDGTGSLIPVSRNEVKRLIHQGRFVTAHDGIDVVGCASVVEYGEGEERIAELRSLKVADPYQGNGVAGKLIGRTIEMAGGYGHSELYALANPTALPVFINNGFEIVANFYDARRFFTDSLWRAKK